MMKTLIIYMLCLGVTFALRAQGQSNPEIDDPDRVMATVDKEDIEGHIYFLASDELRGRKTGSPEIDIAAQYIANTLRRYGAKPVPGNKDGYFQQVPLKNTTPPASLSVSIAGLISSDLLMLNGRNLDFSGEAVFANYGLEEDYANLDVQGKLVVVRSGSAENSDFRNAFFLGPEKSALAIAKGASGLLEVMETNDQSWDLLKRFTEREKVTLAEPESNQDLAHLWIRHQLEPVLQALKGKQVSSSLKIEGITEGRFSGKNVVGMIEGSDPALKDEFVIYSAHYDHMGVGAPNADNDSIFNGARDNAVGVVTVLSTAENLGKFPTKRSALFILFTAEEQGLLGSNYYVQHPLLPLDQMVFCFNSDNGGYNDTSLATIIGLTRTTAQDHIKAAAEHFGLTANEDPAPEQGLFDRSDNLNFAAKGIPAPTFGMGFTGFDQEIMKYYHQPADNPETLDYDYLLKFFRSYVLACRYIANDLQKPFWVDGDKYFQAGKMLYKDPQ